MQNVEQGGSIERLTLPDARIVYVVYAPTCYRQQAVILCAFTDVSAHAEMEQNLTRAKQAADEANDAKSTFLATMSHEIRTPLYGALGTLELLSLTQLNNQQRQYVDRIEGASQMLLQIISDILDISKIEAGQLQLDKSEFNPRELVQECTGAYAGMAHQKGLLLFSIVATDIPERVIGDPARIRQILNNLISNAIKFTAIGTVVVRLSLLERCSLNAKFLLEVCDSGVGIDKAEQEKLFTPFYLIDSANHMAGGAGLGMSICARLAELMNTKIQLRSEPQMGSQFSVELNTELTEAGDTLTPQLKGTSILVRTPHPELTENIGDWLKHWGAELATETDALFTTDGQTILLDIVRKVTEITEEWQWLRLDLSLSGEAVASSDVDAYNLSSIGFGLERLQHGVQCTKSRVPTLPHFNLRILVAEDNPLNQVTLKGQLEKLGCEVTIADDGEEALALWDISPHDMVMTDVNMPYLNGYELARKLRSEGVTSPIIGVTANAMRDEERRCIEAGMNAWLVKPIELKELAELLRKNVQPGWIDETGDEKAFILPEPNVLEKHRNIFLASMREDLQHLADGITQKDADSLIMTLHRMRGALVLAQFRELAAEMEILEQQIQASRLNEGCLVDVVAMAAEINQLLVQIESTS
ncbi:hybrid sensor histidine kinase/response regulator [Yersinia alsatica]|uniref:hybrid sensor histidine kinase/response regulator n=1 Tax=Yersinia alsatica TaxID=2890317 RepID=UPI0011A12F99|nr:hybrid sensor histidine kinase/response regulator [Yersinia alsatica]